MRVLRTLIIVLALGVPFLGITAANHQPTIECIVPGALCPDLIVDGARFAAFKQTRTFGESDCSVQEGHSVPGTRTLLRFTFTTPNVGAADLVVGSPTGQSDTFEFGECHGHWHFKNYADYRLWTPSQFTAYNALRAANPGVQAHTILAAHPELTPLKGDKRGFCVIDLIDYGGRVPRWIDCRVQGISVGWADEYHWSLDGQWIDITGVAGGSYVLEAEVNAEHVYQESNYDNNRAWRTVTI